LEITIQILQSNVLPHIFSSLVNSLHNEVWIKLTEGLEFVSLRNMGPMILHTLIVLRVI